MKKLILIILLGIAIPANASEIVEKDGRTFISVQEVTVSLPNMESIAAFKVWVGGQKEPEEWTVYTPEGMDITLPKADGIICLYFRTKDVFKREKETKSKCILKFVEPEAVNQIEFTVGGVRVIVPLKDGEDNA